MKERKRRGASPCSVRTLLTLTALVPVLLPTQGQDSFDFPFPTPTGQLRVVAWNIEYLGLSQKPRTERQLDAIAGLIGSLDAPVLALQEVGHPTALAYIRDQLGASWRMYWSPGTHLLHNALLYNEDEVEALSVDTLDRLSEPPFSAYPGRRCPATGVFRTRKHDRRVFRVIGIHFCSGQQDCNVTRPAEGAWVRSKVLEYLATPGEPRDIFVVGDFNQGVGTTTFQNLQQGGQLVVLPKGNSSDSGIDHVFITPGSLSLVPEKESYFIFPSYFDIRTSVWEATYSDHEPVFFDFFVVDQPPVASFAATPDTGRDPLVVKFDAMASMTAPGHSIVSHDWDYGDGASASGETPGHTYDHPGEYEARLRVTDDRGITSAEATHRVVVEFTPGGVSPWMAEDVGEVDAPGGARMEDVCLRMLSSGRTIGGTVDNFFYVHQKRTGNVSLIGRIAHWDTTIPVATLGFMVRESMAEDARYAAILLRRSTLGDFARVFSRRITSGVRGTSRAKERHPDSALWLRIERRGDTVSASLSENGTEWIEPDTVTLEDLPPDVHFGIATSARRLSPGPWSVAEVCDLELSPITPPPEFLRGDSNDDGKVDVSDAIATLNALFLGQGVPECDDACDSNDDGNVDISDPIATLGVLFLGQGIIPLPGVKDCGVDPTSDDLGCEEHERCP